MPSFHEEKGLVNHDHPQISKFNDSFVEDLEKDVYVDEPLKYGTFLYMYISSCNHEEEGKINEYIDEKILGFLLWSSHIKKMHLYCWKICSW
jgi:hypothetical protein